MDYKPNLSQLHELHNYLLNGWRIFFKLIHHTLFNRFFILDIYKDCLKFFLSNEYHYRKYYTYIPLPSFKDYLFKNNFLKNGRERKLWAKFTIIFQIPEVTYLFLRISNNCIYLQGLLRCLFHGDTQWDELSDQINFSKSSL